MGNKKISKQQAVREDWGKVKSWNYKLEHLDQSVVHAELKGIHGEVQTTDRERIYFILEGEGEFQINEEVVSVQAGDVLTIPPNTPYNYWPTSDRTLKTILNMELWEN